MLLPFERHAYTVTSLTREIRQDLEKQFSNIWVEGEISNFTQSAAGHAYFTLKDEYSQLKIVIFKTRLRYLKLRPKDGMHIFIAGSITVYDKKGEYQLIGEFFEPKGVGSLQLAFEELKKRLYDEGLFSEAHKKPIPFYPRTVGIITSPTGAALHDILSVSYRRFPDLHVIIAPTPVQGHEAVAQIVQAIHELNKIPEIDLIILARGGGSLEDLWCFNQEEVARAIFASEKPLISAVGHEVDFTISDFVADLRAPTPSAAAELAIKDIRQLSDKLSHLEYNLIISIRNFITNLNQDYEQLRRALCFTQPQQFILSQYQQEADEFRQNLILTYSNFLNKQKEQVKTHYHSLLMSQPANKIGKSRATLPHLKSRLQQGFFQNLSFKKNTLARLSSSLDALSPLQVLKRGFSICRKLPDLELIKDVKDININELVSVTLARGQITCEVKNKTDYNIL